ncbi:unnamed protein product [Camellia sinensis]
MIPEVSRYCFATKLYNLSLSKFFYICRTIPWVQLHSLHCISRSLLYTKTCLQVGDRHREGLAAVIFCLVVYAEPYLLAFTYCAAAASLRAAVDHCLVGLLDLLDLLAHSVPPLHFDLI